MSDEIGDQPTMLARLLSAYSGREVSRYRLLWALDARLARVVASTNEPMIGQLRLAWWYEALTDTAGVKGRGDPLVDALRAAGEAPPAGLTAWLDGWEALIADADLDAYAIGRGGGLFHSLSGQADAPDWLHQAGGVWALWDLAGNVKSRELGTRAINVARSMLLTKEQPWPPGARPMRIAYELARQDIIRGRGAPGHLTPRLYFRLLRTALMAR